MDKLDKAIAEVEAFQRQNRIDSLRNLQAKEKVIGTHTSKSVALPAFKNRASGNSSL